MNVKTLKSASLKILGAGITLSISVSSFANEKLSDARGRNPQDQVRSPDSVKVSQCEAESIEFKTLEAQEFFIHQCFDHYLGSAKPGAVKYSGDGEVLAFGFGRLLFSKVGTQKFVIAGSASSIRSIDQVAIDSKNNELWVTDSDRLLAFKLGASGNLSPLRGFQGSWIKGALSLSIDTVADEIFVLNPKIQRVIVYDRLGDMLYRSASQKLKPKREIYSREKEVSLSNSLVLCREKNIFALLSAEQRKLHVFSLSSKGWSKPLYSLPALSDSLVATCADSKVQVLGSSGQIAELSLRE